MRQSVDGYGMILAMGSFKTIDEARAYFSGDRFATDSGMAIDELDDAHAVCSVTLGERHRNAYGGVMGGAIFTLADFAFAVLTNDRDRRTVAQQVSINYLSAPKGGRLFARASYRKDGRGSCVVNVDVTDDTGRDVAQFVGTGYKLDR
jgi:acyl-CoA thioesterase